MKFSVDVCVPVYNAELYLAECLRSIQRQTIHPNITVYDDGSTDRTARVMDRNFAHHKLYGKKNMGIGFVRNKLVQHSTADYIAFLSADDAYSHPRSLELMMEHATGTNAVYCNHFVCDETLKPLKTFFAPKYESYDELRQLFCDYAVQHKLFINLSTVLLPAWIFRKVCFRTDLKKGEDFVFIAESILSGLHWTNCEIPLVKYRVHKMAGTNFWTCLERDLMWKYLFPVLRELGAPIFQVSVAYGEDMKYCRYQNRRRNLPPPILKVLRKIRDTI